MRSVVPVTLSSVLGDIAAAQGFVVGVVLMVAGATKVLSSATVAHRTLLARWVRDRRRLARWWRLSGAVEALVGSLVLLLPGSRWPATSAAILLLLASAYALGSKRWAPGSPCGCFGRFSQAPVSLATIVRALTLVGMSLAAALESNAWTRSLGRPWVPMVVVTEMAGLTALSPEIRRALEVRRRRRALVGADCSRLEQSLDRTLARLRSSDAWWQLRPYVRAEDVSDYWRDRCWDFVTFPAEHSEKPATAVFAVHVTASREPVRGAVIPDGEHGVAVSVGGEGFGDGVLQPGLQASEAVGGGG
jgi:Methylamine utilisation protein MauE